MDRKRVSRAGKELLANTIQSVTHQNRVLEEKSCWRSHSHDEYKRGHKRRQSPKRTRRRSHQSLVPQYTVAPAGPADRWDHSGFRELYPDPKDRSSAKNPTTRSPEPAESSDSLTSSSSSSSLSSSSSDTSSSDSEDERRHRKRKKRSRHSRKKNKKRKRAE